MANVDKKDLKDLGNGLFLNEDTGDAYVFVEGEKIENPEFNENLQKIYNNYSSHFNDIILVVDGKEMRSPTSFAPLKKEGKEFYRDEYSNTNYINVKSNEINTPEFNQRLQDVYKTHQDATIILDGKPLINYISGNPIKITEDGKYYDDYADKEFTLETGPDNEQHLYPTYLPYEGMTDIKAKVEGNRLVGENGISFEISGGAIITPGKEGLKTQDEIDKAIKNEQEYNSNKFKEFMENQQKETEAEMEPIIQYNKENQEKFESDLATLNYASDYVTAKIYRDALQDTAGVLGCSIKKTAEFLKIPSIKNAKDGEPATLDDYYQLPQIPEGVSLEKANIKIKELSNIELNRTELREIATSKEVALKNEIAQNEIQKIEKQAEIDNNEIAIE